MRVDGALFFVLCCDALLSVVFFSLHGKDFRAMTVSKCVPKFSFYDCGLLNGLRSSLSLLFHFPFVQALDQHVLFLGYDF